MDRNIYKIAIFADNNAVTFFNKQGFKVRKIIPEVTFRKICGFYENAKEMELIILDNNKLDEFKITKKNIKEKKKEENLQETNNDKNLNNFKIAISDLLNELTSNKVHSNISRNYNSYSYPSFCLMNNEPIDLINIKNTILSQKYKKKEEIVYDINKAILNIKSFLKDNIQEYETVILSEKYINEFIEHNREI